MWWFFRYSKDNLSSGVQTGTGLFANNLTIKQIVWGYIVPVALSAT